MAKSYICAMSVYEHRLGPNGTALARALHVARLIALTLIIKHELDYRTDGDGDGDSDGDVPGLRPMQKCRNYFCICRRQPTDDCRPGIAVDRVWPGLL